MARKNRGSKGELPFGVKRNGKRFQARVKYHKTYHYLGTYKTIEEAATVAMDYKKKLYGLDEEIP